MHVIHEVGRAIRIWEGRGLSSPGSPGGVMPTRARLVLAPPIFGLTRGFRGRTNSHFITVSSQKMLHSATCHKSRHCAFRSTFVDKAFQPLPVWQRQL